MSQRVDLQEVMPNLRNFREQMSTLNEAVMVQIRELNERLNQLTTDNLAMEDPEPELAPPLDFDRSKAPSLRNKIPPMYINHIDKESWEAKVKAMEAEGVQINPGRRAHIIGDSVRLIPNTMGEYKKIKKLCTVNKWPHYTYGLPEQRRLKVAVKGLNADASLDGIKRELQAMRIPVCRVHRMHTTPGLQRPPLFMVVTYNTESGRAIFGVSQLLGRPVTVERLVPKVGQCHRCQKWGHSQRFCQRPVKCLKCAGDHTTSKCRRDPETEPLKCANCFHEHTANYKECPIAVAYSQKNAGKRSM